MIYTLHCITVPQCKHPSPRSPCSTAGVLVPPRRHQNRSIPYNTTHDRSGCAVATADPAKAPASTACAPTPPSSFPRYQTSKIDSLFRNAPQQLQSRQDLALGHARLDDGRHHGDPDVLGSDIVRGRNGGNVNICFELAWALSVMIVSQWA